MSGHAGRAEVAEAIAAYLWQPDLRDYLEAHPDTRDADGDPVIIALAADESMDEVINSAAPHAHAVMLSTVFEGQFFICTLGEAAGPSEGIPSTATAIDTDATTTVAELVRALLPLADGAEFAITYQHASQPQQVLVGSR